MVFPRVDQAVPDFPALERRILQLWREREVFHRSLLQTEGRPEFVFYEGPPTANGLPHNGHVLTRAIKDLFPRFKTMCGYDVPRKAGWDTHGLPVEVEVEKELGIHGKADIEKFGIEPFIARCVESVFRYTEADDFGTPQNAFLACTYWYIDAIAALGRREEARALFENLLACRNRHGLLAEHIDPATRELWGNYPQTYSMVGLINSATRLSIPWEKAF